jgi:protein-tyrosine phosphatase
MIVTAGQRNLWRKLQGERGVAGLGLQGAPNGRDLGEASALVRRGLVYRTGALGRLTDDDVSALDRLGLRTVIDLRDPSEVALAPPDRLPEPGPSVVALPIYDPRHPVFTYVSAVLLGGDGAGDYAALAEEGTPGAMVAIYRWFVSSGAARSQFGAAIRLLARADRLPALLHCSAGKDRTGWLTATVLGILGVDRAAIEADYLATNDAAMAVNRKILDAMRVRRPNLEPAAVLPVFEARPEYLAAAYAEMARLYGSFEAYLARGLGLDDAVLDALRVRLAAG